MLDSLYAKIAAGLTGLFLLVGLVFVGVTVFSTDMYQQEVSQKLNTGLAGQIVKERLLLEGGQVNQAALREIFHMLMVINPGIEIYLLDTQGRILTFSAPQGSVKRESVRLDPVKGWLSGTLSPPVLGDDPKSLTRKKVFSAAPIEKNGVLEGFLYVILDGEEYDSVAQKLKGSYILQLSAWMAGAGLLFALVAGLALFALLTGRLKKLAAVMEAFKQGDTAKALALPEAKTPADEIDRLTATFRQMACRIDAQMEELKASDQERRELMANVSHDLRTPLATLQGYMETLLIKENQYSEAARRRYLDLAIRHCKRLSTLVGALLELARLESPRLTIQAEPFNIQELVQDICQKFDLAARQKQITLGFKASQGLPLVLADIAMVERALENLIENGLRHTPEKGRVTIDLSFDRRVVIQVTDTGPGIPKAELARIFERFYHRDPQGGHRDGHTGLGLAITRRIAELHQSALEVESLPGQGSCFSFSLPPAPEVL